MANFFETSILGLKFSKEHPLPRLKPNSYLRPTSSTNKL